MTGKVIQGSFLAGKPKIAPSLVQAKMARPPAAVFAGGAGGASPSTFTAQRNGSPAPSFAARPPGPPAPAFAGQPGTVQRHGTGGAFAVESGQLGLASGGGKPLPEAVRSKMEAALGADFSGVRVYVGPQAERIGAIAFTVGSDIYFAPGRYQPDTIPGQQLLGHELAHVVQQRAGRVRNPLGAGLAVVQDRALEAEADRLGQRAALHRAPVQAKRDSVAMQRLTPARTACPPAAAPGGHRPTANPAARSSRLPMSDAKLLGSAKNRMPFRPGSPIQRNIDSTYFEKSAEDDPLYFVDPNARQVLYGREGAPSPRPKGLYTKTQEYDDGQKQRVRKWIPNVRFLTALERQVDVRGDKLVYRAESGLTGVVDLARLRQHVEKVAVRQAKPPTIGVLGKNDCVQFADLLYNLMAQEGIDLEGGQEKLREIVESYTEKFPQIQVGQMMKHFFTEEKRSCHYHGATVVAVDGKALVTLEGNADKPDLTAPEFYIREGVGAFVKSNIGPQGAKEGDRLDIVTHKSGNPETGGLSTPTAYSKYEAFVDPSKAIWRTFTYYSNNIGVTRNVQTYDAAIRQIIQAILLSPSSDGFWREQTPLGTSPPDGIVSMRQLVKTNFRGAVDAGAQKALGPRPSSRSPRTHEFYLLVRNYKSSSEGDLPAIYAEFERFLQDVRRHRVVYPGHQW